jgi:selenophosphate synthetase-related protein
VCDFGATEIGFGDDAAVLKDGDSYLLFSADGIWSKLISNEPYAAGKASVMVSVNDIYAMGGRPIAMVNVIATGSQEECRLILEGIKKGCEKFRVPMVGGHVHPNSNGNELSVAIIGRAKQLLTSHTAKCGQDIILAIDLEGRQGCKSVKSWDSNSGKTSEEVLERLEVLPFLAEEGLCETAKDISNGGILGTIGMLLETSRKGGIVYPGRIPKPDGFDQIDWLKAFPSYGFVLCTDTSKTERVISEFKKKGVHASIVGEVIEGRKLVLIDGEEKEVLFDFSKEIITGI